MLNVRAGEGRLTTILLVHSFFLGVSLVFFNIAAGSLFLAKFDASHLPWVYVGAAVLVTIAGSIYSKLEGRLQVSTLLMGNLAFLLLSVAALRFALMLTASKWLLMVVFAWYELMAVLTSLEYWGLAGRLLNVRQGKRLFGLIGSGEIAAGILTGFSVPLIVGWISVENFFFFSALGLAASSVILMYITRAFPDRFSPKTEEEEATAGAPESTGSKSVAEIGKHRYLRLIFALSALSVLGYFFVDFAFYEQIESRYPDEAALAGFLGVFAAVEGISNLLLRALLTGYLLTRFGLGFGLMSLPLLLGIVGVVSVGIGTFMASASLGIFFWFVVATKLIDRSCRTAIDEPSVLLLYQPLARDLRLKAQAVIESIVEPISGGVAGLLLILLTSLFAFTAFHALAILLAIVAAWLIIAVLLRREYTVELTRALTKRLLHGDALSLRDQSSIDVLRKGVESRHAGEAIYAIGVMEEIGYESMDELLLGLLDHASPEIRLEALRRIDRRGAPAAMGPILRRLEEEQSPQVIGRALQTICALGESEGFQHVLPYLDDPEPEIRCGALVGLLRSGIDGVLEGGQHLNALLKSSNPKERAIGVRVLGEVGIRNFFRPVQEMLRDPDPGVRRAALTAAGKIGNPQLWPLVIENLSARTVRSVAASSLIAGGEEALPALDAAFDAQGTDVPVRQRIVRICGRIRGDRAIGLLKSRIDFPHPQIREQVLSSLRSCGYRAAGKEEDGVVRLIGDEGRAAAWTAAALVDIGKDGPVQLLRQALKFERKKNLDRIFLLLSFIHDPALILQARDSLASDSLERRAYALEIIDNLVTQELKRFLVPLVDDIPEFQRLQRLTGVFPEKQLGRSARLEEVISHRTWTSPWTQATALLAGGQLALPELGAVIADAARSPSPLVRETAVWAMRRIGVSGPLENVEPLAHRADDSIGDLTLTGATPVGTDAVPLSPLPRKHPPES